MASLSPPLFVFGLLTHRLYQLSVGPGWWLVWRQQCLKPPPPAWQLSWQKPGGQRKTRGRMWLNPSVFVEGVIVVSRL